MNKKELLSLFEKVIENFEGTILIANRNGQILFANENLCKKLTLSKEEVENKTVYDLSSEGYISSSIIDKAIKENKEVISYIIVNGKENIPVIAYAKPIFNDNGEIEIVIAYSQNEVFTNTALEIAEEEKKKIRELLNYIDKNKSKQSSIIANSKIMRNILSYAKRISTADSAVIISGESGTGKEVIARYIYNNSKRKNDVYIPINCSSLPFNLMESEFFGYEKGAFTGANSSGKSGLFEICNEGTLFLDEIGEMPLNLQSKFLRVLETGEFKRLGGNKVLKTNVRLIAATNRNLLDLVKKGKFRQDLYYRLNVINILIPPIRDRKDDILPLALNFLSFYNQKYERNVKLSKIESNKLIEYNWPGNVREIRNVIERMVISYDFNLNLFEKIKSKPTDKSINESYNIDYYSIKNKTLKEAKKDFEKYYIQLVLNSCNNKIDLAAKKMDVHISGLYKKINDYNILYK